MVSTGTAMLPSYLVQVSNSVTFFLSIFHLWLVESVAVETTYWTVYCKLSAAICLSASESPRACYSTDCGPHPLAPCPSAPSGFWVGPRILYILYIEQVSGDDALFENHWLKAMEFSWSW